MKEDEALLSAALANSADRTPALALADWFDEHGEPELAVALRDEPQIVVFLGELARWDVVPGRPNLIYRDSMLEETFPNLPAARLLTRYHRLFARPPGAPEHFDADAPPPAKVDDTLDPRTFLSRWQYMRQRHVWTLREEAARHAAGRRGTRSPFGRTPPGLDGFEWRSCVVQEMVVRGNDPTTPTIGREHIAAMRERAHPLAWLPVQLSPLESGFGPCLVQFGPRRSYGVSSGPPPGTPVRAVTGGLAVSVVGTTTATPESHAPAAVRGWSTGSNGQWEAGEFRLDRAARADYLGRDWFRSLPLADVFEVPRPRFGVSRIPASSALTYLFLAAQSGGAYTRGDFGAYSRLHAWQSFGWLAGCDPAAGVEAIAAKAGLCDWFTFGGTEWFNEIAWDLGMICLRPDGESVAALAASDVD
jgi:uncharacterized protein (TIGR02996 family)